MRYHVLGRSDNCVCARGRALLSPALWCSSTHSAMSGSMKMEDSLKARLGLMKPSKQLLETCLKERPAVLSPGAETNAVAARPNRGESGPHLYPRCCSRSPPTMGGDML